MDDTRDIAINAAAKANANEQRLNGINGQIGKLGDSHEQMREDFNRALYGVGEGDDGGLVGAVIELKATVSHALKIAAVIGGAVVSVSTGLVIYTVERHASPAPVQAPKTHATARQHHEVSGRERVSSGLQAVAR